MQEATGTQPVFGVEPTPNATLKCCRDTAGELTGRGEEHCGDGRNYNNAAGTWYAGDTAFAWGNRTTPENRLCPCAKHTRTFPVEWDASGIAVGTYPQYSNGLAISNSEGGSSSQRPGRLSTYSSKPLVGRIATGTTLEHLLRRRASSWAGSLVGWAVWLARPRSRPQVR